MSPDGNYIAFMSDRSLTGYDNVDVNSGAADEEVFLYDATTGKTVCASCNPTGSRPAGVYDTLEAGEGIQLLVDRPKIWNERWLSGNLPGWTAEPSRKPCTSPVTSPTKALFFNSAEALMPQDSNGKEDVYEYEPKGLGDCTKVLRTFSAHAGGCVSLISGGSSIHESAFLDASANGNDVFFLTAATLGAQDNDTSYDVYDASVCGQAGAAACLRRRRLRRRPARPLDACRPSTAPPGGYGTPATSGVSGNGNITSQQQVLATKGATTAKAPTRAQKLAAALRVCKKEARRSPSRACEKQARKKYGPVLQEDGAQELGACSREQERGRAMIAGRILSMRRVAGIAFASLLLTIGVAAFAGPAEASSPWWLLDVQSGAHEPTPAAKATSWCGRPTAAMRASTAPATPSSSAITCPRGSRSRAPTPQPARACTSRPKGHRRPNSRAR